MSRAKATEELEAQQTCPELGSGGRYCGSRDHGGAMGGIGASEQRADGYHFMPASHWLRLGRKPVVKEPVAKQ